MKFLITAGPTREALDPVRYLTNRSSGRMGYALAGAARHEGHEVILISGPTTLDVPAGVDFIPVESAQQMYEAVRDMVKYADVAILCAAVADYRPVVVQEQKMKKSGERLVIELEKKCDCKDECKEEKHGKYIRREFSFTKYHQTLILPENVDKDEIKASAENGILNIEIPKLKKPKVEEEKRMIEVK